MNSPIGQVVQISDANLSLSQAAKRLGMSKTWLWGKCKAREIEHTDFGGKITLRASVIDAYRAAHTVEATGASHD